MKPIEPNDDEQWEDIVRRLRDTSHQAQTPSFEETNEPPPADDSMLPLQGPRDYRLSDEVVEDFRPPDPKPIASGNPRTVLSWTGLAGSAMIWILAALLSWPLPWWLSTATLLAFLGGAASLFFLLPKSYADRDPFDDEDYGSGAKL